MKPNRYSMIVIIIGILVFTPFLLYLSTLTGDCKSALPNSSLWTIQRDGSDSYIKWEHEISSADRLLNTNQDLVVFYRGGSPNCDKVVAVDISTGDLKWEYPARIVRAIYLNQEGVFLALCCTYLERVDFDGQFLWSAETIPVKDIVPKITSDQDSVYLLTSGKMYRYSITNGSLLETTVADKVFAKFGSIEIHASNPNKFEVKNIPNNETLLVYNVEHDSSLDNYHFDIHDDLLMVAFSSYRVQVFDLSMETGLWELEGEFDARPRLSGDYLLIFANEAISVYEASTGQLEAFVQLQRADSDNDIGFDRYSLLNVILQTLKKSVVILYGLTPEIVVTDIKE